MKRRPASDASTSAGEPLDICEGQQGIEPGHVMPQRGNGGDAIRRRAHRDGEGVHRMLLVRQVNLCRRVLVEAAVFDVPDDADDRLRSVARVARELRADSNLLSNGVLSREESLCGPFVDEDDLRTRRRIAPVEWPAGADRDLHHLEVFRADDPHRGRRHRCRVRLRLPFVTEAGQGVEIARERKAHRHRRRFNTGFRLQSREQRRHERSRTRGIGIPGGRQRQAERRDAFGFEARLDMLELNVAANEQAGCQPAASPRPPAPR